mgnify:CR=1 FL=1
MQAAAVSTGGRGLDGKAVQRQRSAGGGAGGERFGVLVDGEYYGPFAQVQLVPCVVPGETAQLALPVRTFRPVE